MWETYYCCVECKKIMSFYVMMNSHGTCPYCGNCSGDTVVNATAHSRRKVYKEKNWFKRLFNRSFYYEYK